MSGRGERQEKDIFHVTGLVYNALNYYEKWRELPCGSSIQEPAKQ